MKEKLQKIIYDSLINNSINVLVEDIIIDVPKDKNHGDYTTNVAMKICKKNNLKPCELGELIINNIHDEIITNIELVNPGFINFTLKKDYLVDNVKKIIQLGDNYGKSTYGQKRKINVEYVSVNPTGLLHIGHARGAAFGDSLTRILSFAGYNVTREYYVNDAGNQVNNLGKSIKERYKQVCGKVFHLDDNCYHGEEIVSLAKEIYSKYNDTKLEENNNFFIQIGLDKFIKKIKEDLEDINVNFDVWASEKEIYKKNLPQEALSILKQKDYTYEKENAIWLKTALFGDEKDRVLVKNDGTNTYFMPDIAYHLDKLNRDYDEIIDIFGADHHGYVARLKSAVKMLGGDAEKLHILLVQMVRLIKNNEEYKLSKRTGKTLTVSDLKDEIGVDALRYFFVSKSLDTQMDFNIDLAISKSNENPIYYIEYAYARICSILRECQNKNIQIDENISTIDNADAYNVLAKLYQFDEIVIRSAEKKEVHLITNYLYELATLFHSYYASHRIITDNKQQTANNLALVEAIRITLKNALYLIGINPKERM